MRDGIRSHDTGMVNGGVTAWVDGDCLDGLSRTSYYRFKSRREAIALRRLMSHFVASTVFYNIVDKSWIVSLQFQAVARVIS
ncbi:unnamed protein product [Heligmosomoides polygyrus]|uniref:Transposase n=1 Tax=Heligmosomoides polygyrus TaxID=6339 RepID=A0A183FWL7_HELPZ|nr:unnamed protein product [Heligmosomoides polygyrus]